MQASKNDVVLQASVVSSCTRRLCRVANVYTLALAPKDVNDVNDFSKSDCMRKCAYVRAQNKCTRIYAWEGLLNGVKTNSKNDVNNLTM
jgi:hypothetical protein